jgi:hypothetical protein
MRQGVASVVPKLPAEIVERREEIRIEIGRLIVNAPAPERRTAVPAAATAAPRVSLDQYLRQRGGRN